MKKVYTLFEIFDKVHPNMTSDELLSLCHNLRDLKLKNNKYIKNVYKNNSQEQIKVVDLSKTLDHNNSAAFYNAKIDKIIINKKFFNQYIEEDTPFELIATISHELEHYAQKYTKNKNLKKMFSYTQIEKSELYNLLSSFNYSNDDYKKIQKQFDTAFINSNDHNETNNYKALLELSYAHFHVNSNSELDARLFEFVYIGQNLEAYIKTVQDQERKEWLTKQLNKLNEKRNDYFDKINNYSKPISNDNKKIITITLLNCLVFYIKVKGSKFKDMENLQDMTKFVQNFAKLAYLSEVISNEFKIKYLKLLKQAHFYTNYRFAHKNNSNSCIACTNNSDLKDVDNFYKELRQFCNNVYAKLDNEEIYNIEQIDFHNKKFSDFTL